MGEIYRALEALAKYLGADPIAVGILLVLPLALMYFRFKYHQDVLKSPRGLAGVRERLATHGDWRSAYFGRLRRALAWVDCQLGPSLWSADSYEFTLSMAFIYPFFSLLITWLASGQSTSGVVELLPEQEQVWRRAVFAGCVCSSTYLYKRSFASSGWRGLAYAIASFAFGYIGAVAVAPRGGFAVTLAVAFTVAITSSLALAGAAAITVAAAFIVAGGFARAIAAVTGAIAGVAAIVFVQPRMTRGGRKSLFYILFLLLALCFSALTVSHPGWFQSKNIEAFHFTLVFLVLLPLINSIFDWLSLAATRALLKSMAEREETPALQVAWNALVGLFLGVLLLAGLAVTITAGLQTVNLFSQSHGGPEYIDLAGLLHRLRGNPADPAVWWVYLTLFSTMLPTVFHAAIASASFVTWRLPDSWKRHWLDLIGTGDIKDDHRVLVGMAWRLTLMDAATVLLAALSAAILAWLLFWLLPLESGGLLWLCETVAEWLGAPIRI